MTTKTNIAIAMLVVSGLGLATPGALAASTDETNDAPATGTAQDSFECLAIEPWYSICTWLKDQIGKPGVAAEAGAGFECLAIEPWYSICTSIKDKLP